MHGDVCVCVCVVCRNHLSVDSFASAAGPVAISGHLRKRGALKVKRRQIWIDKYGALSQWLLFVVGGAWWKTITSTRT